MKRNGINRGLFISLLALLCNFSFFLSPVQAVQWSFPVNANPILPVNDIGYINIGNTTYYLLAPVYNNTSMQVIYNDEEPLGSNARPPYDVTGDTLSIIGTLGYYSYDPINGGSAIPAGFVDLRYLYSAGFSKFNEPWSTTGSTIINQNSANGGTLNGLPGGLIHLSDGDGLSVLQAWVFYQYYPKLENTPLRFIANFTGVNSLGQNVSGKLDFLTYGAKPINQQVPEPGTALLLGAGFFALKNYKKRISLILR